MDPREIANELEGHIMDHGVVTNMLSGRSCDIGSYGATIDYNKLTEAIKALPTADWASACLVWEHDSYLSPAIGLLTRWVPLIRNAM